MTEADPDRDVDALLRHGEWIRRLALRLCADAHGAADAAQDAWVAALEHPPRHGTNLRGWFAALVRNGLLQRRRGDARRAARDRRAPPAEPAEATDAIVARAELHRRLVDLVLALPEPQRALCLLHYFEGIAVDVIARDRGQSVDAVRAHLRRARVELRNRLDDGPERHRRALFGLAASLPALPAPAAAALILGIAMKKVLLAATAVLALAIGTWAAWPALPPEPTAPRTDPTTAVATADAPAVADRAVTTADARTIEPRAAAGPTDAIAFTVQLRGLHPRAPWTAAVHLDLDGRDEQRDEWLRHDGATAPDGSGACRFELPAWAATMLRKFRVRADDDHYLAFDLHRDEPLPASREFAVEVQVVAILRGRVVTTGDEPVPAARVAAFGLRSGEPQDGVLGQTTTAADGTYFLQVPPDEDLFVVAAAMQEMRLSGQRGTGNRGAIADLGTLRADLLPTGVRARGDVGRPADLDDLVLAEAARIMGIVRWSDGRPVPNATVHVLPDGGGIVLRLGENASLQRTGNRRWAPVANAETARDGRFELPSIPGAATTLNVSAVKDHVLRGAFATDEVVAPRAVQIELPLPIVLRATDGGVIARDAEFEFALASVRNRGVDGELRVVLGDPGRGQAPDPVCARAGKLRSAPVVLVPAMAGTAVDLPMRRDLARVAVEFDGAFRIRNGTFRFEPLPQGIAVSEHGLRDDRGLPFEFFVAPGRYRLVVSPGGGERNGMFLLRQEREIDVPPSGLELRLPATLGARLTVDVTDGNGRRVAGRCRVVDGAGRDWTTIYRVDGFGLGDVGELRTAGPNELMQVLPPGDYDLELDLGSHGIERRRVVLHEREAATVAVRAR